MAKKVKFKIPKENKLKPEDIAIQDDYKTSLKYSKLKRNIPESVRKKQKIRESLNLLFNSLLVIIFFLTVAIIIVTTIRQITFTPEETNKSIKQEVELSNNIIGSWQSSNKGLFTFDEKGTFYWYNSYENIKDNYYKGTYSYKTGQKALNEMGYTEKEFTIEFGENIKLDNIYSINLKPTTVIMSGIDISTIELNKNETWWFILIVKDDGNAYAYNKTLDLKYNLIKKAD